MQTVFSPDCDHSVWIIKTPWSAEVQNWYITTMRWTHVPSSFKPQDLSFPFLRSRVGSHIHTETHRYSFKVLSGFLYMKSEPCLGSFIDSRWNDHKFFPHTRRGLEGPPCHSLLSCSTSFSHCGDTWPLPLISFLSLSLIPFSFPLNLLSRPFSRLSFSMPVSFCHWHLLYF